MASREEWKKIYGGGNSIRGIFILFLVLVSIVSVILGLLVFVSRNPEPVRSTSTFEIISMDGGKILVKNTGEIAIKKEEVSVYVNNQKTDSVNDGIQPGMVGTIQIKKPAQGTLISLKVGSRTASIPVQTSVPTTAASSTTGKICPAVCTPMWQLRQNTCAFITCGSGCGPDNITTFSAESGCRQRTIPSISSEPPNASTTTQTLKDVVPPKILSSASPGPLENTVTLTVTVADDSGIKNINIYADEGNGFSMKKTCTFSPCSLNFGPYASKTTISYYSEAYDLYGNRAITSLDSFSIMPQTSTTLPSSITTTSASTTSSMTTTTTVATGGTALYTLPVLDLSYIPVVNNKVDISLTGDWQDESIDALLNNINNLRNGLIDTLEKGSVYHGYKDQSATASLNYDIMEKKTFYTDVPKSSQHVGMDGTTPSADHMKILNELNICDYVENKGFKEVWIWMYHTKQVAPIESNMAGPYGDISNSYRVNDLPVCKKTYTVYDYNYGRAYSMAVEDHMHQIEAILNYADSNLFWNLFVGTNSGGGRCGWTHYPPNGIRDYDWNNENGVVSDCEDWKPDGSGQKKLVSCYTWSASLYGCDTDEGLLFKKWWMQNIPGKGNNLGYNGKTLRNWWEFFGDFDKAIARGKNLAA